MNQCWIGVTGTLRNKQTSVKPQSKFIHSFTKTPLKFSMSSAKRRPFCRDLNVLKALARIGLGYETNDNLGHHWFG